MNAGTHAGLRLIAGQKRCELEAVRWVEANTPAGSHIAAVDVGPALRRYRTRAVLMLHESDPASWSLPPGEAPGLYLIWDESFIQRHLARRSVPGDKAAALIPHARWLRSHARLTPLARVCRWEILRVNAPPESVSRLGKPGPFPESVPPLLVGEGPGVRFLARSAPGLWRAINVSPANHSPTVSSRSRLRSGRTLCARSLRVLRVSVVNPSSPVRRPIRQRSPAPRYGICPEN
jgi:hypothetical protein